MSRKTIAIVCLAGCRIWGPPFFLFFPVTGILKVWLRNGIWAQLRGTGQQVLTEHENLNSMYKQLFLRLRLLNDFFQVTHDLSDGVPCTVCCQWKILWVTDFLSVCRILYRPVSTMLLSNYRLYYPQLCWNNSWWLLLYQCPTYMSVSNGQVMLSLHAIEAYSLSVDARSAYNSARFVLPPSTAYDVH